MASRKRGPKSDWTRNQRRLMPIQAIARRLGISARTVCYDLAHAMKKLGAQDHSITLAWVRAVAIEDRELLQAGSLECDRSFIEMYAEKQSGPHSKKGSN